MRYSVFISVLFLTLLACNSNGQKNNLSPIDFQKALQTGGVQLVDVRTQEEFNDRHLDGAVLMNWTNGDFEKAYRTLDKTKPVYVYCLSGGRSGSALNKLLAEGYKAYNLNGGLMAWEAAKLPLASSQQTKPSGMTLDDYLKMVKGKKAVLVDFTAVWCGPCRMMKPTLRNLENKYKGKVDVVEVDVDKNRPLAQQMQVRSIPLLILYSNGKEVWRTMGVTDEATFDEAIKKIL